MRVAVSSDGQAIKESKIVPTPDNFEQGIQTIKQVADELSGGEEIDAVAGGIAGPLDKERTMLIQSSHLGAWVNKPLKQKLEEVFGAEVKLENDAKIEGLGEAVFGPGKEQEIVAYICIGTGVGSARIVDGKIDKNPHGFEAGHQIIVPDGNACNCGGKGHLEAYIAGSYIEKNYGQKGEEITDQTIWDEISRYLAIGLTNVAVHWSPDIVILGGSVAESIPLEKTQAYFNEFLTVFPVKPPIVKGTLGEIAGLWGALELLK